jgi:plasmid maintenance system antidote protein VapI
MNIKTASELQQILATRYATEPIKQIADELGIAEIYLTQIVAGQRSVSKRVAERMGYRIVPQPKPEKIFMPI